MLNPSGMPAWRPAAAGRVPPALLLLCALPIVAALRTPHLLHTGRFWAEEATVYFRDAALSTWYDALLAPRMGYFSAWNKLAAAAVPLEWAPLATVYAALAVQLAVAWIALRSEAFA